MSLLGYSSYEGETKKGIRKEAVLRTYAEKQGD